MVGRKLQVNIQSNWFGKKLSPVVQFRIRRIRANKDGWRWFARVSQSTNRADFITNEIRNQVQVYMEFPMEGW